MEKLRELIPKPLRRIIAKIRRILPRLYSEVKFVTSYSLNRRTLQRILEDSSGNRGVIVYPPTIDWGWMKQRPHHIMSELANQGYLVFFCTMNNRTDSVSGFGKIHNNLYLCGDIRLLYSLRKPILFIGWTEHHHLMDRFVQPKVIYDYLDDLAVSAGDEITKASARHKKLLDKADIVLTTSSVLNSQVKSQREDALLIPNAVSVIDFKHENTPSIPTDLRRILELNKPIVGYYGALARWFDYKLLDETVVISPEYNFVLIGPDYDGSLIPSRVCERPNVFYLGEKSYDALSNYLYYFDVATIPFEVNEITLATSPVKLYEYFCAGKPVVSTRLPECAQYQEVLLVESSSGFKEAISSALVLSKSQAYQSKVKKIASQNSWEARVREITRVLEA